MGERWTVLRHGGRLTDTWRTVCSGDRTRAEERYWREHERMRQGGVRLVDPDGRVVMDDWAPRLRTRW